MTDGKSLVSGWTDGKIRSFLPQSGKLYWIINNAHKGDAKESGGCLCLTSTLDGDQLLSGGTDCQVNLWHMGK